MYPAERQSAIVAVARDNDGTVAISELTALLDVTAETIRRDLDVLQRQGLLTRHRGGASLATPEPFETRLAHRNERELDEKRRIAARVIDLLPDDGAVLIDSGSTTQVLAEAFPDLGLTVVTNNVPAIPLLARRHRLSVFALPGRVRDITLGVVDLWAWQRLHRLRAVVAIVGANGVTAGGVTTVNPEVASFKRSLIEAARFRILAVTSSKIGRESFCRYADLTDFDVVVVDSGAPDEIVDEMREVGPEIMLV